MEQEARHALNSMVGTQSTIVTSRTVEMRYVGQFHEIEVPLASGILSQQELNATVEAFHARHEELYTFRMPWKPVEYLTFRLKATVHRAAVTLQSSVGAGDPSKAIKRRRICTFAGKPVETPVYQGEMLGGGDTFAGPAIIEERTTTVVIPQGYRCSVDEFRNYVLTR
jgi:N-methylhydantoinase A